MMINLNSLLPDTLSDEAAYQVVKLFAELALALEKYYNLSMRPHPEFISDSNTTDDVWVNLEDEDPF